MDWPLQAVESASADQCGQIEDMGLKLMAELRLLLFELAAFAIASLVCLAFCGTLRCLPCIARMILCHWPTFTSALRLTVVSPTFRSRLPFLVLRQSTTSMKFW